MLEFVVTYLYVPNSINALGIKLFIPREITVLTLPFTRHTPSNHQQPLRLKLTFHIALHQLLLRFQAVPLDNLRQLPKSCLKLCFRSAETTDHVHVNNGAPAGMSMITMLHELPKYMRDLPNKQSKRKHENQAPPFSTPSPWSRSTCIIVQCTRTSLGGPFNDRSSIPELRAEQHVGVCEQTLLE